VCVGHATSEYLFRIGPGVSYGVRVPVQEGEDEAENRWETIARMRTNNCVYSTGHPTPEYLFRVGVSDPENEVPPCRGCNVRPRSVMLHPCDMFNYDRVLYSSPEEAAAAQTLYKFFLRYTRYFTYPAQAPSPSARTGLTVTHHT
jgi:hypothetical protein